MKFYVERENNSYYETRSLDDVLSDDNVPGKAIRTVSVALHKSDHDSEHQVTARPETEPLAYVAFRRIGETKSLFFVSGEDRDWCFLLADDLDTQLQRASTHRAFPFLPRYSGDFLIFSVLCALVWLWAMVSFDQPSTPEIPLERIQAMDIEERTFETLRLLAENRVYPPYHLPIMLIALGITFTLLEIRPISRISDKVNRSVFYWGDMQTVHDKYDKKVQLVKWGIIIAFFVSLFGSLVGGFLLRS